MKKEFQNPVHYNGNWTTLEYIEHHNLGFAAGNVIKYVTRYEKKDGLKDLLKARDYLDRCIKTESEKNIVDNKE